MSTPTNEREAEIRERLAKAASGPWSWSRTYEMADVDGRLGKHWCLNNPTFAKKGQCIDGFLVTETTAAVDFGSRPLDQTPNFDLIANAPADLSWLLSRIEELAKERDTLAAAVKWALGEEGMFPPPTDDLCVKVQLGRDQRRREGKPHDKYNRWYWWRGELRQRAFPSDAAPSASAVENSAASSSGANTP